jgi:ABC-2 type transport system ATP-binding protein
MSVDGHTYVLYGGSSGKLDKTKKKRIGYMPEERGLYRSQPLEPTLVFLATLKGLDEATARRRLVPWLKRLDLYDHRKKKVQDLSKGMQQKAQIIATLVHEPDVIIVDEPFAGLDPVNTLLVKEIIAEQCQAGRTVMMSTHQMHQVEALCSRIVLINSGRVMLYGQVEKIKHDFAGNAITLAGTGDFAGLPGVLEARRENDHWHLALQPGTDSQDVFRALAAREGVKIEHFDIAEASLDDIFIAVVQGQPKPVEGAHA